MTDGELMRQALAELGDVVRCRCHECYTGRGLHDPDCQCDSADALATVETHIEAMTEQLEAARADAKQAEAYAEELAQEIELNEQEACSMEDDLMKAYKEIDALKAKLAKAVEALRKSTEQHRILAGLDLMFASVVGYNAARDGEAALAEIEGDTT